MKIARLGVRREGKNIVLGVSVYNKHPFTLRRFIIMELYSKKKKLEYLEVTLIGFNKITQLLKFKKMN
jgi:hypothetical protein